MPARWRKALTIDQAAAELDVHHTTIRRWIHDGELPALKMGRRYWISRADLVALIESRVTGRYPRNAWIDETPSTELAATGTEHATAPSTPSEQGSTVPAGGRAGSSTKTTG